MDFAPPLRAEANGPAVRPVIDVRQPILEGIRTVKQQRGICASDEKGF